LRLDLATQLREHQTIMTKFGLRLVAFAGCSVRLLGVLAEAIQPGLGGCHARLRALYGFG
jgi:hypothetical protein